MTNDSHFKQSKIHPCKLDYSLKNESDFRDSFSELPFMSASLWMYLTLDCSTKR